MTVVFRARGEPRVVRWTDWNHSDEFPPPSPSWFTMDRTVDPLVNQSMDTEHRDLVKNRRGESKNGIESTWREREKGEGRKGTLEQRERENRSDRQGRKRVMGDERRRGERGMEGGTNQHDWEEEMEWRGGEGKEMKRREKGRRWREEREKGFRHTDLLFSSLLFRRRKSWKERGERSSFNR